jgi:hypothetical protein
MENDKKKMQSVAFQSVAELLDHLPEDQLDLTLRLRDLIFECIPNVEERLSFNVPFYRRYRGICFIWPGVVAWGPKTYSGVEFGFNYGNLLQDAAGWLDRGQRKQVYTKRFYAPEQIREDLLRAYLLEAVEIDELLEQEKLMKRRKRP